MDALDILRVLRRRWKITAVAAAVLVVLVGAVLFLVPKQYKVTAISLVTPALSQDVQNPYTVADRVQSQMAALLVTVLTSPAVTDWYTAQGANGTIEVTNANGVTDTSQTDSPFITIIVTDKSADGAVHGAQLVRQRALDELKNRQDAAKVTAAQRLILTDVLPPADPTTTRASQYRAVGLVAALGLVLGVLGVVIADRVLTARSRREPAPEQPVAKVNGDHRQGVLPDLRPVAAPKDESPTIKFSPVRSEEKQGGGSRR
ncbi:Wzz/FepE/Etk N-terminal domain-containing protein [Kutzneria kofuensis]|uniref:Capsular polysaccharide biosynthesis protein n=1 Tax=Kutzneria kofuensis TaxID=103725 RepID=A0A7W9KIH4_9PSEU|nr:Wzz/FepE/Etk N-terminal domain-containing protein [Kutzneria kofuensis]MBB5893020.1 capsular polysaccharide biosynthesis protein [Kutzneria kofuensis]